MVEPRLGKPIVRLRLLRLSARWALSAALSVSRLIAAHSKFKCAGAAGSEIGSEESDGTAEMQEVKAKTRPISETPFPERGDAKSECTAVHE